MSWTGGGKANERMPGCLFRGGAEIVAKGRKGDAPVETVEGGGTGGPGHGQPALRILRQGKKGAGKILPRDDQDALPKLRRPPGTLRRGDDGKAGGEIVKEL